MVYKKFRVVIIFRILLLVFSAFILVYLLTIDKYRISGVIIGFIIFLQTYYLIRYVERTNKKITQFLESIRHSDFSSSFTDKGLGKNFEQLRNSCNEVMNEFKKNRGEREEHFNYLQTVVQHVSIGIISYKKDGKVDMINNAFKRMFRIINLRNIKELERINSEFPELLLKMRAGDKNLIKIFIEDELMQISIYATEFRMRGEEFLLVSLQNIHTELEEKEIESWQRLIRVLTHEIMNSITPISSLATTVKDMLIDTNDKHLKVNELNKDDIYNIENALLTIQNRSQGLLNFVEIYRNLTRIPKPNFRYFPVKNIFERAEQLLKPKFKKLNIKYTYKLFPEELMLTADPDLVDQVIINLLLNAIDAVKGEKKPQLSIIAYNNKNNKTIIDIIDNGFGIKPDNLDKIFMPFFTSKKDGSGIGLSLSRQIMHLHKGNISVKSKPDEGTVFTLTF